MEPTPLPSDGILVFCGVIISCHNDQKWGGGWEVSGGNCWHFLGRDQRCWTSCSVWTIPQSVAFLHLSWCSHVPTGYSCIYFFNVYLFLGERERETECEWGRDRERGRHRIWSRLQALSCQHRARRGAQTHELWDNDLSWSLVLNQLSHSGPPDIQVD